jgi:drug/metabolite transporter (DMT)-like permease
MTLGFVAVAVFAGSLPATRLAVASLDANFITAARAAIAGLIALPVLLAGRRPPPWRELPKLGLCALCLVAGFPAFTAVALRSLPAAHGGVVLGALPLATAFVAALVDRDRPSPAFWLCSGLGAALVVGFALSRGGGVLGAADALLLVAPSPARRSATQCRRNCRAACRRARSFRGLSSWRCRFPPRSASPGGPPTSAPSLRPPGRASPISAR